MAGAPTAKRYAQALFGIAKESGSEEAWLEDLRIAQEALAEPTVVVYMGTPRVAIKDKLDVTAQLLSEREPMIAKMVGLLVSRQASSLLPAIVTAYGALLNESLGRIVATVTAATDVSAEQRQRLTESLSAMLNKDVVLEVREDPSIIGGAMVRVGDQIIDGSVRTRLQVLKQRLERESLAS
jgi:F-type H+-transporting ATPase subunit delta